MKKEKESTYLTKMVLEEIGLRTVPYCPRDGDIPALCRTTGELCHNWLQKCYHNVKKSTYSGYCYFVNMHILPFFGDMAVEELDGVTISKFIDQIKEKELADTTVHSVLVILKMILKHAVRLKLLDDGLLDYCNVTCHRPESRVLSLQESNQMKEYLLKDDKIFSIAILLCRNTGIRLGELCGLKWEDLDFTTDTFRIRRTISRIPNPDTSGEGPKTMIYIRPPKSNTSAREIPIPRYLVEPLKKMRKDAGLYLLTGRTTCMEPRNVQKRFKTVLRHCALGDCNFHAMRHGFATACLEKGIDCKTVSSILGHASTRTTMDFYVHTSMRQKADCINSVEL